MNPPGRENRPVGEDRAALENIAGSDNATLRGEPRASINRPGDTRRRRLERVRDEAQCRGDEPIARLAAWLLEGAS